METIVRKEYIKEQHIWLKKLIFNKKLNKTSVPGDVVDEDVITLEEVVK